MKFKKLPNSLYWEADEKINEFVKAEKYRSFSICVDEIKDYVFLAEIFIEPCLDIPKLVRHFIEYMHPNYVKSGKQ